MILIRIVVNLDLDYISLMVQMVTICLQCRRHVSMPPLWHALLRPGFDPWVGKIPWRRAWQPTPVFLTGESPWTKEPGGLHSIGWQRVWHDWVTKHSTLIELPVKEMVCLFQECAHPGCGNCASYSQAASREPEKYGRWSINIELNVKINMTQMKLKDACSLEEKLWPT